MYYVFLAEGFEEIEAVSIIDILRRADVEVTTIGVGSKDITGTHGIPMKADRCTCEGMPSDIEGVILPGGLPGTPNLMASKDVAEYIDYCAKNDKWICAICAAPMVLGKCGVLNGKKAVCYPGCEDGLTGAVIGTDIVTVDGKIVTSKGPGTASEFGLKLAELFKNEKASLSVRSDMLL